MTCHAGYEYYSGNAIIVGYIHNGHAADADRSESKGHSGHANYLGHIIK
jgi:hypothetical protein